MIKKVCAVILSASLCLSMAACSSSKKEPVEEATTEAVFVDDSLGEEVYKEFSDMLTQIYESNPGSAGSSDKVSAAVNSLIDFSMNYGEGSSNRVFEGLTTKWMEENADKYGESFEETMIQEMDAIVELAAETQEGIDTDVAFLNVINGIYNALGGEVEGEADEGEEEIVNPMTEVTQQELVERTGIDLPAPEGATDVTYFVVDTDEYTIAQMDFTLDGQPYELRAAATGMTELDPAKTGEDEMDLIGFDFDAGDISGLYYEWTTAGTDLVADRSGLYRIADKDDVGYIAWLDVAPGILYNLSMTSNASHEALLETAEKVFVPVQG